MGLDGVSEQPRLAQQREVQGPPTREQAAAAAAAQGGGSDGGAPVRVVEGGEGQLQAEAACGENVGRANVKEKTEKFVNADGNKADNDQDKADLADPKTYGKPENVDAAEAAGISDASVVAHETTEADADYNAEKTRLEGERDQAIADANTNYNAMTADEARTRDAAITDANARYDAIVGPDGSAEKTYIEDCANADQALADAKLNAEKPVDAAEARLQALLEEGETVPTDPAAAQAVIDEKQIALDKLEQEAAAIRAEQDAQKAILEALPKDEYGMPIQEPTAADIAAMGDEKLQEMVEMGYVNQEFVDSVKEDAASKPSPRYPMDEVITELQTDIYENEEKLKEYYGTTGVNFLGATVGAAEGRIGELQAEINATKDLKTAMETRNTAIAEAEKTCRESKSDALETKNQTLADAQTQLNTDIRTANQTFLRETQSERNIRDAAIKSAKTEFGQALTKADEARDQRIEDARVLGAAYGQAALQYNIALNEAADARQEVIEKYDSPPAGVDVGSPAYDKWFKEKTAALAQAQEDYEAAVKTAGEQYNESIKQYQDAHTNKYYNNNGIGNALTLGLMQDADGVAPGPTLNAIEAHEQCVA